MITTLGRSFLPDEVLLGVCFDTHPASTKAKSKTKNDCRDLFMFIYFKIPGTSLPSGAVKFKFNKRLTSGEMSGNDISFI